MPLFLHKTFQAASHPAHFSSVSKRPFGIGQNRFEGCLFPHSNKPGPKGISRTPGGGGVTWELQAGCFGLSVPGHLQNPPQVLLTMSWPFASAFTCPVSHHFHFHFYFHFLIFPIFIFRANPFFRKSIKGISSKRVEQKKIGISEFFYQHRKWRKNPPAEGF